MSAWVMPSNVNVISMHGVFIAQEAKEGTDLVPRFGIPYVYVVCESPGCKCCIFMYLQSD